MLESISKIASKYGLFPAIALLALLLGGVMAAGKPKITDDVLV